MTASAAALNPGWRRAKKRLDQPWQQRATELASQMGVIRFACGVSADACARATLLVEKLEDPRTDEWEPVEDNEILADVMRRYKGKATSQRELVREHAWLQDTVGEAVQILNQDGPEMDWEIRSPIGTDWQQNGILLRDLPSGSVRDGTARMVAYEQVRRLWIPNETWPLWATSPLKGVLDDCERYLTLGRRIQREAQSALVGNGIIWTPSEAHQDLPRQMGEPQQAGQPGTNFERDYYAVAERSFDESTATVEAVAPIMWHWPGALGPPQKIDLAANSSKDIIPLRAEALECIARGLNYPQQLLIDGGASNNHWGAWLLQESFAKEAIAPKMERICWGDLTETFLRPAIVALNAAGLFDDDPHHYRVGFDLTPVVVHPDQTANAIKLYTLGVLSDTELLKVSGFDSTAAPDREELGRWIVRTQIARESIRPQTTQVMPTDASTVLEQTPAGPPTGPGGPANPAPPALTAALVPVGPLPGEELGWIDI